MFNLNCISLFNYFTINIENKNIYKIINKRRLNFFFFIKVKNNTHMLYKFKFVYYIILLFYYKFFFLIKFVRLNYNKNLLNLTFYNNITIDWMTDLKKSTCEWIVLLLFWKIFCLMSLIFFAVTNKINRLFKYMTNFKFYTCVLVSKKVSLTLKGYT